MRASKHVTHSLPDAQEVFEVSIARLKSEDVALPVAATTEAEAITLFLWNQQAGKWTDARVSHVPIATERGGPAITNTWNWSRRVGLATAKDRIYLVYKRAFSDSKGDPSRPALFVETFEVRNDGSLQSIQRIPVPMPMFTISGSGSIVNPILRLPGQPGFELWAGIDLDRERLLIVTQILGERATSGGEGAELRLFTGDLSSLDQEASWRSNLLEQGGYGLDVRHTGDKLTIVHRKSSHSVKVPLPIGQIDPFFAGSPQLRLDASAAADQNYTPLQIVRVDLPIWSGV